MKKRDLKVELIRLIACMSVIWYHIRRLPWKADGTLSETAVFFECVCTICVMTFFLISGFYIYDKEGSIIKNWLNLIKNFFTKVFPLFLIALIVSLIFHDYFISVKTIPECLLNIDIIYIFKTIFRSFIHLSVNGLPGTCGHLWYVYAYFFIILYYPLTRLFLKKTPDLVKYIVLFFIFVLMVINDYLLFFDNPIINFFFEIVKKPVIYTAFGYVLYHDIIEKHLQTFKLRTAILSTLIYIVTFILLLKTQISYDLTINGEYVYTSWLSAFSLIMTSSFVIFVYNINIYKFVNQEIENIIYYLSSKTYSIYIVHYFIITKLLTLRFQNIFFDNHKYFIQHLLYHIFYSLFIFILSLLFILLAEKVFNTTKKFLRRHLWLKEKNI